VLILVILTLTIYASQQATIGAHGQIKTTNVNIDVYWDSKCEVPCQSINWGTLKPGDKSQKYVYILNRDTSSVSLIFNLVDWQPTTAQQYISLSWNLYTPIPASSSKSVLFTLSVSPLIQGVTSFSFNIVISGA